MKQLTLLLYVTRQAGNYFFTGDLFYDLIRLAQSKPLVFDDIARKCNKYKSTL